MTLDNYFIGIYAWTAFWTLLCAYLMVRRTGKNAADWEIIGFRFCVGMVMTSVVIHYLFNERRPPQPITPYIILIAVLMTALGYFAMRTTMRIIGIVRKSGWGHPSRREDTYYPNDETPEEGIERRHREIVDTIPDAGMATLRPKEDLH